MTLPWPPARARVVEIVRAHSATDDAPALIDAVIAFHAIELMPMRQWITAYKHHHETQHADCRYQEPEAGATLAQLDHVTAELAEWKEGASRNLFESATLLAELVAEVKSLRAQLEALRGEAR